MRARGFKDSLGRLHTKLDGMFFPGRLPSTRPCQGAHGVAATDPERYKQVMDDLSGAREEFLEAHAELVNALNGTGLLTG